MLTIIVLRNPVYFIFLILLGVGAYVTYTLNLWGPMLRMANAASAQAVEVGKERLREFLESSEAGRQTMAMSGRNSESISLDPLDSRGRRKVVEEEDDDDEIWGVDCSFPVLYLLLRCGGGGKLDEIMIKKHMTYYSPGILFQSLHFTQYLVRWNHNVGSIVRLCKPFAAEPSNHSLQINVETNIGN